MSLALIDSDWAISVKISDVFPDWDNEKFIDTLVLISAMFFMRACRAEFDVFAKSHVRYAVLCDCLFLAVV